MKRPAINASSNAGMDTPARRTSTASEAEQQTCRYYIGELMRVIENMHYEIDSDYLWGIVWQQIEIKQMNLKRSLTTNAKAGR